LNKVEQILVSGTLKKHLPALDFLYRTVFDSTNRFCGTLVFLVFCQWLFC